jgi:2-oxoglutarate dehydrogenase E1 component
MGEGTSFQPVLDYRNTSKIGDCNSVIFCSGKFVYDIEALAVESKAEKTCIIAIEELYPFPEKIIADILSKANKNAKFYWVQEENFNGGAFQFA